MIPSATKRGTSCSHWALSLSWRLPSDSPARAQLLPTDLACDRLASLLGHQTAASPRGCPAQGSLHSTAPPQPPQARGPLLPQQLGSPSHRHSPSLPSGGSFHGEEGAEGL